MTKRTFFAIVSFITIHTALSTVASNWVTLVALTFVTAFILALVPVQTEWARYRGISRKRTDKISKVDIKSSDK